MDADVQSMQSRTRIIEILRERIRRLIRDCEQGSFADENFADSVHFRVDFLQNFILRNEEVLGVPGLLPLINEASTLVESETSAIHGGPSQENRIFTGKKGRPRYDVTKEHLQALVGLGFNAQLIGTLLGTSTRTIERRLNEFGLRMSLKYSQLGDAELDNVVREVLRESPNAGYQRMTGHLRARGVTLQRDRIRNSMRRVDPEGILLRSLEVTLVNRRKYNVRGPLALWHIDGNHKLIR